MIWTNMRSTPSLFSFIAAHHLLIAVLIFEGITTPINIMEVRNESLPLRGLSNAQGSVVRTPVSTNPGLNFNPAFFFLLSKALSRIIFSILFRVFSRQIVGKKN